MKNSLVAISFPCHYVVMLIVSIHVIINAQVQWSVSKLHNMMISINSQPFSFLIMEIIEARCAFESIFFFIQYVFLMILL